MTEPLVPGVSVRLLAMPTFMDNILRQLNPILNQGMVFHLSRVASSCRPPGPATLPRSRSVSSRV